MTRRARRILFVTPRYLPMLGGIETHVLEVSRRLVEAGLEVTVATSDPSNSLPWTETRDGVTIRRVPAWPDNDLRLAPGLVSLIDEVGAQLVHVQGYHTLIPPTAMLAARAAGIPYLLTFHSGGHSSPLRTLLRGPQLLVLRPLLLGAERLVAVSPFEADLMARRLRLSRRRFAIIPNGTDLPQLPPGAVQPEPGLLLSVGRLERYKGHGALIDALPSILTHRPDAHLRIAGSGPIEAELRCRANELGVGDRVEIASVPPSDRRAMAELLSRAGVVAVLSDYESQGLAALEAASLGRPVLVGSAEAFDGLVAHGAAVRVEPGDPHAVTDVVLAALRGEIRPAPVHLPTWDETAADLLELYEEILATPSAVVATSASAPDAGPYPEPSRRFQAHPLETRRPAPATEPRLSARGAGGRTRPERARQERSRPTVRQGS